MRTEVMREGEGMGGEEGLAGLRQGGDPNGGQPPGNVLDDVLTRWFDILAGDPTVPDDVVQRLRALAEKDRISRASDLYRAVQGTSE